MAYDLDPIQNHCYPGTTVLVNKYGIRQQKQLDEVEALVVSTQTIEFELSPFPEPLSFDYYKRLHAFLFDQLYDWAGIIRDVDLSKQHTRFCPAKEIVSLADRVFSRAAEMNYFQGLNRQPFIQEAADFYTSINCLHPFREGNGRTQRVFFRELARRAGYTLDYSAVDPDILMLATIHAASGVQDTLLQVFDEMIQ